MQRLVLEMPRGFDFSAGQYLEVLHADGSIPLSIASAPHRLPELHLHYLSQDGLAEAGRMDELLETSGTLEIAGPAGDVRLAPPLPGPALIVAGGTGAAQAMSFLDTFGIAGPGVRVTLLWCADSEREFYLRDDLEALSAPWLERVLVADPERSPANRGLAWLERHGGRFAAPSPVVLCGGPGFVYAACDALLAAGVRLDQMQSDVFAYAPRP